MVYAYYSWMDKNGNIDGDYRPVVIMDLLPADRYRVVKVSRSNKKEDLLRVSVNSPEWKQMGLYDLSFDSHIDRNAIREINEEEIDIKLGTCPVLLFARI